MKVPGNSRADILQYAGKSMAPPPGVKTPDQPDEAGAGDAGDVVEGPGVSGSRRVCRVVWWFLHADEQM
jgi:hypothetical protein